MARDFAESFYHSKAWKTVRQRYWREHHLCERCLARGIYARAEIVHHKEHLSPANIDDPAYTIDDANLEALCRRCHADEHPEIYGRDARRPRVLFDDEGNVIPIGNQEAPDYRPA